ncbi:hypothetical protein MBANPS3_008443 [Mucor bainieri]
MAVDRLLWEFSNQGGFSSPPSITSWPSSGQLERFEYSGTWLTQDAQRIKAVEAFFGSDRHLPPFEVRCGNPNPCGVIWQLFRINQRAFGPEIFDPLNWRAEQRNALGFGFDACVLLSEDEDEESDDDSDGDDKNE